MTRITSRPKRSHCEDIRTVPYVFCPLCDGGIPVIEDGVMRICKCGKSGVDATDNYTRMTGALTKQPFKVRAKVKEIITPVKGSEQNMEWDYTPRADGREEWTCDHGVGHGDHVHGCDGCCSRADFPLNVRSLKRGRSPDGENGPQTAQTARKTKARRKKK